MATLLNRAGLEEKSMRIVLAVNPSRCSSESTESLERWDGPWIDSIQTSSRSPVPSISPSCLPQHVDFDFSFFPHGHKIVTVSLPTAPVWELSPSVSLAKKKHFSEAPTAAAPASPLWSHWWDLSRCVCDGYVTESHPWMEEAGLALRLGCWLGSDSVDDHWADSVETPTGVQC